MTTGRLAVWWVIVSEIVIFGGLLASYLMHRLAHPAWSGYAANTNTWIGAFNTLVLLTSSLSAVLAHQAAEAGDGKKAAKLLRLTTLGGGIFVLSSGFWSSNSGLLKTRNEEGAELARQLGRSRSPHPPH